MQIPEIIERLGIEPIREREPEILAHCPAHEQRTGKEDFNPSWWINMETGQHICFSCGFKGSIYSLISTVLGIKYEEVGTWIGDDAGELQFAFEKAITKKREVFQEVTDITEANLAAFIFPTADMLKSRGITPNAAEAYEILYDVKKNAWILPIRNAYDHKLVGWQEKGVFGRYFRNYPTGVPRRLSIFGYKNYVVQNYQQMIVVESPLDCARLQSVGITGAVATYGSFVSQEQFEVIRGCKFPIFAMDNDDAGREASANLRRMADRAGLNCSFFNYGDIQAKDVGGMTKDEIVWGIENKQGNLAGRMLS